ncbi:alpha/beta hydrolase fold protein [Hyphomicrobium denitrificans 1NES1]|uniref:Alpha/beta hydrolase fold protein n=1 Tax=Hyphomicrobium denitrificans 1NES1 TaxID=670307 RepID=N0B7M7_9HYPH|nr:alpha/beta hydrolase fold protein [Hyphomicrobium denitrificans 1NES1]
MQAFYPERVGKIVYLEGGYDWSDPTFFKAFTDMLVANNPNPAESGNASLARCSERLVSRCLDRP